MNIETNKTIKTYRIKVTGIVQGVGFRPFIFNLACRQGMPGSVSNTSEAVIIEINTTSEKNAVKFIEDIKKYKPSPALIENIEYSEIDFKEFKNFQINKSIDNQNKFQLISPDLATCKDCVADINNTSDKRRYGYPFTNCTNCGPRFTIIESLPYDRPQTTMKKFDMCPQCEHEYLNQFNRRFHAQPVACSLCGPKLWLTDNHNRTIECTEPIQKAAQKLKQGYIVAIKSLGGFQLAVDATNACAVKKLRSRKNRPHKPLAIMVGNIKQVKKNFKLSPREEAIIDSPRAPIVLLEKKHKSWLAPQVSFYNRQEGVMLPYTPLHHLLFNTIDFPLIMTSGNNSEEPIARDNQEALDRLSSISDFFLLHNRDIYSRYDDSVVKVMDNKEMVLRRARGYSPYPIKISLDTANKVILALGAQEKNTFCILTHNYALVSQHLGELDDLDSFNFFKETLKVYQRLFNIKQFDMIVHDKHPAYTSTRYARQFKNIPILAFQHHKAHIASVIAENHLEGDVLGFAWDGTGYGDDGKIWGSEIFIYHRHNFERWGHLSEKLIPGAEAAIKNPYRMAISYLYEIYSKKSGASSFSDFIFNRCPHFKNMIKPHEIEIIAKQLKKQFNSPETTSMGRLFDAVSSILDLTHIISYEGQAAIHLESIADVSIDQKYDLPLRNNQLDDISLVEQILEDIEKKTPASVISAKFHNCLVGAIIDICKMAQDRYNICQVALSGGVFQNSFLLSKTLAGLKENGFKAYTNFKVPVNDGGISLGQAYLAALKLKKEN